jgi:hypothetical protein
MPLVGQAITLTVAQIEELSQHFSSFRHDVNNSVGMVGAAAELVRYSPQAARRWSATVIEQPPRIAGKTREFAAQVRRTVGLRNGDEPSWYRDLWSRTNATPADVTNPTSVAPDATKALYVEMIQLHKELSLLAFAVSGVQSVAGREAGHADEMAAGTAEQVGKVARKFNQFADLLEKTFGITSVPHRLLTGLPQTSVTLSAEQLAALDQRLNDLERNIQAHLNPLITLSHVARTTPEQLQNRAGELAPAGPKISAEIQKFSADFDATLGIQRSGT